MQRADRVRQRSENAPARLFGSVGRAGVDARPDLRLLKQRNRLLWTDLFLVVIALDAVDLDQVAVMPQAPVIRA